jgi:hypothetical protein
MRYTRSKEVDVLIDEAKEQGMIVERCGSGHIKVKNPEAKAQVVIAYSASDHRNFLNVRASLRRLIAGRR